MAALDKGITERMLKQENRDAAIIKSIFFNKRAEWANKKGFDIEPIELSEEDLERSKSLVLDDDNARTKIAFWERENTPFHRLMLYEENMTFNVCPSCGRMNKIEDINDTFDFCSKECDEFDSDLTPDERDKTKKRALAFYEGNLSEVKMSEYPEHIQEMLREAYIRKFGEESEK